MLLCVNFFTYSCVHMMYSNFCISEQRNLFARSRSHVSVALWIACFQCEVKLACKDKLHTSMASAESRNVSKEFSWCFACSGYCFTGRIKFPVDCMNLNACDVQPGRHIGGPYLSSIVVVPDFRQSNSMLLRAPELESFWWHSSLYWNVDLVWVDSWSVMKISLATSVHIRCSLDLW